MLGLVSRRFSAVTAAVCLSALCLSVSAGKYEGDAAKHPNAFWLASTENLHKISSLQGTLRTSVGVAEAGAIGTNAENGQVWAVSGNVLYQIAEDGEILNRYATPPSDGEIRALAVDGRNERVWLATRGSLYQTDFQGQLHHSMEMDDEFVGISLAREDGHLWIAGEKTVRVYDVSATLQMEHRYNGRGRVVALDFDDTRDIGWVAAHKQIIGLDRNGAVQFTLNNPIGQRLVDLQDSGTGHLWLLGRQHLSLFDPSGAERWRARAFNGAGRGRHRSKPGKGGGAKGGGRGRILAADPWDGSVWIANHRQILHFAEDGAVAHELGLGQLSTASARVLAGDVYADIDPPKLEIKTPEEGEFTNDTMQPITLEYSDVGSGVDIDSIQMQENWESLGVACEPTDEGAVCRPTTPFLEGEKHLAVTVADFAFNQSEEVETSFTVDITPPKILKLEPADGLLTNQPNQVIEALFNEPTTLAINGSRVTAEADGGYQYPVTLQEGMNEFTIVATDRAGNVTTATRRYELDTIPPEIILGTPARGLVTDHPDLRLAGSVNEPATVRVNGDTLALNENFDFAMDVTLVPGITGFTVEAVDLAGNETVEHREVEFDATPPAAPDTDLVTVSSPDNEGMVTITGAPGSVEPGAEVVVTVTTDGTVSVANGDVDASAHAPYHRTFTTTADQFGAFRLRIPVEEAIDIMLSTRDGFQRGSEFLDLSGHLREARDVKRETNTVGRLQGEASVSGGAATYDIPIKVPPGRAGMEPNVSLTYSSRAGNGIAGMGWSLEAAPRIRRCAPTLAQDGFSQTISYSGYDRLCLNDQRLILIDGQYGKSGSVYRTELESFSRISLTKDIADPQSGFTVERKNGNVAFYGAVGTHGTPNAVFVAEGRSAPYAWGLHRVKSRERNNILYEYSPQGNGEVLLNGIYYTGRSGNQGDRSVRFAYGKRPDGQLSYQAQGKTTQSYRLKRIDTFVSDKKIREYVLSYGSVSNATSRSLLRSVQECAFKEGKRYCKPKTSFQWQATTPGNNLRRISFDEFTPPPPDKPEDDPRFGKIEPNLQVMGDYDGDGQRELLYRDRHRRQWMLFFGSDRQLKRSLQFGSDSQFKGLTIGIRHHDFDNDGRVDLVAQRTSDDRIVIGYWRGQEFETSGFEFVATSISTKPGRAMHLADFDGDGDVDIAKEEVFGDQDSKMILYENTGSRRIPSFSEANRSIIYEYQYTDYEWSILRDQISGVMDIDGNGLPDFLIEKPLADAEDLLYGFLLGKRNRDGGVSYRFVSHEELGISEGFHKRFYLFADVNGDGLKDLAFEEVGENWKHEWRLRLNKGGQFGEKIITSVTAGLVCGSGAHNCKSDYYPKYAGSMFAADWDNDGAEEIVFPDPSERVATYCLASLVDDSLPGENRHYNVCGASLYSAGAGVFDRSLYKFRQLSFSKKSSGKISARVSDPNMIASANVTNFGDLSGDGLTDLFFVKHPVFQEGYYKQDCSKACGPYKNGIWVSEPTQVAPDLIVGMTDGFGNESKWKYHPLSEGAGRSESETAFYEVPKNEGNRYIDDEHYYFTSSMRVVSSFSQSHGAEPGDCSDRPSRYRKDCRAGMNTVQYSYREAMYNNDGRGFQGFREIIEEDFDHGIRTRSVYNQKFPLAGRIEEQTTSQLSNSDQSQFLTREHSDWRISRPLEGKTYWVSRKNHAFEKKDFLNGYNTFISRSRTTSVDPSRGCVTRVSETTEDPFATYVNSVRRTFTTNRSDWWLCRLDEKTNSRSITYRQSPYPDYGPGDEHVRRIRYQYNGRRQVRTEIHDVIENGSPRSDLRRKYTYTYFESSGSPAFGRLKKKTFGGGKGETSVAQRRLSFTYSTDGYFLSSRTNPEGHATQIKKSKAYGKVLREVDANGVPTKYDLDAFGRPVFRQRASFPAQRVKYLDCGDCPSVGAYKTVKSVKGAPDEVRIYDSRDRVVRKEHEGFDSNEWVRTDIRFDRLGNVVSRTEPHFAGTSRPPTTVFEAYDVMGRLREFTDPKGVTTAYNYIGLERIATVNPPDGSSFQRHQAQDAFDNLIRTRDPEGNTTHFRYDARGNGVLIQDAKGNRIATKYNGLGKKSQIDDPNQGVWSFVHDVAGNLVKRVDAKSQVVEFDYDKLDRKVRRVDPEGETSWAWDTAANGVGRLHSVEKHDGYKEIYTYDDLSRVTRHRTVIDDIAYDVNTTYDAFNRPEVVTYPDRRRIEHQDLPGVPRNVAATEPMRDGAHEVTWDPPSSGDPVDYYEVFSSKDQGSYDPADTVNAPETRYSVDSIENGTYRYKVTACNGGGCSAKSAASNAVSVILSPTLEIVNTNPDDAAYVLDWEMPSGADPVDHYKVYERYNQSSWQPLPDVPGDRTILFMSEKAGGLYDYKVKACSGSSCSPSSNIASVYVSDLVCRPDEICTDPQMVPSDFEESSDSHSIKLTTESTYRFSIRYKYNARGYLREVSDADTGEVFWTGSAMDPRGNVVAEAYGNGVEAFRTYNDASGYPEEITAGIRDQAEVQHLTYSWSSVGNLETRTDKNQGITERFSYDRLDRVTNAELIAGPARGTVLSLQYDEIGNIQEKNGQLYDYGSRPHAVSQIDDGGSISSYTYDANGNMITRGGASIEWTVDNKPSAIEGNGETSRFRYAPSGARYKQVATYTGEVQTTHYVGRHFREVTKDSAREFRHQVFAGERQIATVVKEEAGTKRVRYHHLDYLESATSITDEAGQIVNRMNFGAYGERRSSITWYDTLSWASTGDHDILSSLRSDTHKGFTGHEMLDGVGLVHMNGRVYDPGIGRFLSVDPAFSFPTNTQSLNAYSYAMNNPFSFTDPTGDVIEIACGEICKQNSSPLSARAIHTVMKNGGMWTTTFKQETPSNGSQNRESDSNKKRDASGKGGPSSRETGSSIESGSGNQKNPNQGGYSPDKGGWHDYTEGPNTVCSAEQACTAEQMADYHSRFAVPGQDPSKPVTDQSINKVYDPRIGLYAGKVTTYISADGLTITNVTRPGHVFHDGQITRALSQDASGAWSVTTRGIGNNILPGAGMINQWQGPKIFNYVDQQMRSYIETNH